jgi:5-methylcytosine-specific restriction enzyme subunit McrC
MQDSDSLPSLRENQWYLLADFLDISPTQEKINLWQREVRSKAKQIKHDLGLRPTPLSLEEREEGWSFRAAGIAGMLRVFDTQIQVMPKFVGDEAFGEAWQASVLTMLDRVRRKHYTYSRVRNLGLRKASFIDHVAQAYKDALESALRQEPIHIYRTREETSPFLRGRFAVGRQMQSFIDRPHRIHCEVDYLETDNQFNQLLRWAGNRLAGMAYDGRVRRLLSETVGRLPAVSTLHALPGGLRSSVPPQYKHYAEAIEIASALAKGYAHGQEAGQFSGYGYVLNMEKLFEGFVERTLAAAVEILEGEAFTVEPQDTRLYAEAVGHKDRSYYTRPDVVVYQNGAPVLLIDAKYKKFSDAEQGDNSRPEHSDVYQMFASLISHKCERGLLVYPRMLAEGDPGDAKIKMWKVSVVGEPLLIGAVAVDISNLSSKSALENFDSKIAALINEFFEVNSVVSAKSVTRD